MRKTPIKAGHQSLKLITCSLITVLFMGCAVSKSTGARQVTLKTITGLKYVNQFVLPNDAQINGIKIGGLSGIDYDAKNKEYYLICDDRSHLEPARFYKATIDISATGINKVAVTAVVPLLQQDGSYYPEISRNATHTTDPEAMRMNWRTRQLTWTSEGDRNFKPLDTVLINPTINVVDTTGKYVDLLPLPPNLKMQKTENGPRRNGVLEGLSFADDFRSLYVSLEEPRFEDGPQADLTQNNAQIRLYKFELKDNRNTAQYAYRLDPVPFPAQKEGGAINNGIPDILWIGHNKLLVTERAFSTGRTGANVKVFLADISGAENIIHKASLLNSPAKKLVSKKLILNMDDLGIYIDNIEGATFGPLLANGHQSLIFVADNNYLPHEQSQFLLFEVIP
ncbi:esterase-like activity of phytase family protein [Pedobacter sp. AW31-3R]|uniref:esterase-like activity of phytase family protein n=1 Tax=Pedobacter sp. AW31-3R TaxID=3445781 RepID=UPI003FA00F84